MSRAYKEGLSLSASNIALISRLRNVIAEEDVLFVSACDLLKRLGGTLQSRRSELARALGGGIPQDLRSHLWRLCPQCGCRARCEAGVGDEEIKWTCKECGTVGRESLDFTSQTCIGGAVFPTFLPKVTLCNSLDLEIYRFQGTSIYAGGIDHMVRSRAAFLATGGWLPPLLCWEPSQLLAKKESREERLILQGLGPGQTDLLQRGRCPQLLHYALMGMSDRLTTPAQFSALTSEIEES